MSVRILMVGAGAVAQRHVDVLQRLGADVVGVVDPVRAAARRLAEVARATVHPTVDLAIEQTRPEAVYVCVPPFAHGELERTVLLRGLPLFVEKPLAADLDTAEEVARLVADADVVTGTGYHWRCLDTLDTLRQALAGRSPLLANGHWWDKRPPVAWWSRVDRSGGQVVEQLTHVLDVMRVLMGEATEVYAAGGRRTATSDDDDVDDVTAATVRFGSGAVATLSATSVLGAKDRAALEVVAPGLVAALSETGLVLDDGSGPTTAHPAEDPRIVVDREFLAAVRGERPSTRAPYAEALHTHRLGWAIARSAREGRPVALDRLDGDRVDQEPVR